MFRQVCWYEPGGFDCAWDEITKPTTNIKAIADLKMPRISVLLHRPILFLNIWVAELDSIRRRAVVVRLRQSCCLKPELRNWNRRNGTSCAIREHRISAYFGSLFLISEFAHDFFHQLWLQTLHHSMHGLCNVMVVSSGFRSGCNGCGFHV